MNKTGIEWTDYTSNPVKFRDGDCNVVWGCVHASPGCQHCYAETLAKRYGRGGPFSVPTMNGLTPYLDDAELRRMLTYKPASGKRCFVGDMTDIFGEWVPDELLDRLFAVMALRTDVTWQVLTKRAARMQAYCKTLGRHHEVDRVSLAAEAILPTGPGFMWDLVDGGWALPNVWLGVSVEDQERADERIPLLLQTPAAVRFISAEPLLGGIDIAKHRPGALGLHWAIIGGESGGGARPCCIWWIENLIRQCHDAGISPFVKQVGSMPLVTAARLRHWEWRHIARPEDKRFTQHSDNFWRVHLTDRKGGATSEWPEALRVREFPA